MIADTIKNKTHNMLALRISRRTCLQSLRTPLTRHFHPEFTNPPKHVEEKVVPEASPAGLKSKYEIFRDEDSQEIFDVEEEKRKYQEQANLEVPDTRYEGLNLERELHYFIFLAKFLKSVLGGISAVFEIEDLVHVLRKENAKDIFVCKVPKEFKYVDYMVIVTGRLMFLLDLPLAIHNILRCSHLSR